jgi:hypothetical protein
MVISPFGQLDDDNEDKPVWRTLGLWALSLGVQDVFTSIAYVFT